PEVTGLDRLGYKALLRLMVTVKSFLASLTPYRFLGNGNLSIPHCALFPYGAIHFRHPIHCHACTDSLNFAATLDSQDW
ncbi:MAG: hypothetical protein ACXQTH_04550, partial [Dehalococcoidia bacterium]